MKSTKTILAALLISGGLVLSGCGDPTQFQGDPVEVEDCDAEDLAEGDEDCYGMDLDFGVDKTKVKKTKKPGVKTNKSTFKTTKKSGKRG